MSSLVSNFLINPVARTVRRLSTPFATNTTDPATDPAAIPEPVRRPFSQDFHLDHGDVITECDGPSISFPSLSFLRGPDIALGARSPPLLIPQQRRRIQYPVDDSISTPSTARSPSPSLFEMDPPNIINDPVAGAEVTLPQDISDHPDAVPPASRALPANDGMEEMRRRILSIQFNDIFNPDQKRYLMQQILTENYARARHAKAVAEGKVDVPLPQTEYPTASGRASASGDPSSSTARDLGFGIAALETLRSWTGAEEEQLPINISEEDAEPSYRYRVQAVNGNGDNGIQEEEEEVIAELGCPHYKRNVKVQCAACEKWYTCRLCHDMVEDHILPRKHTKHMFCMLCKHPQKASDACTKCGESAASYYCNICKLWSDDVDKHIYHCDECGICRVGHGLEKDFFHCKTCRACISISTRDDHKCIERATDANCPICGDNMFDSPLSVIFMECGHPIHKSCFDQYMATSYKCPLCSKSIVKMDALFLNLSNIIKEQPMPEDWKNVRSILLCNDCSAKSSAPFHFLGLQCENCRSYNTIELQRSANPANPADPALTSSNPALAQATRIPSRIDAGGEIEGEEPSRTDGEEDEDEELDFWGRDPRSESSEDDEENDEEDDEEDELSEEEDEDDDDDDDENDEDIILLGHR